AGRADAEAQNLEEAVEDIGLSALGSARLGEIHRVAGNWNSSRWGLPQSAAANRISALNRKPRAGSIRSPTDCAARPSRHVKRAQRRTVIVQRLEHEARPSFGGVTGGCLGGPPLFFFGRQPI